MINPWKVFETNINSRPLLKWLDPRSFCKASPAQESHRLQSGTCFSSSSCGFSQFTTNAKICSFASEDLCKCLNTSGTQADVEVGLVICPKTWKPIWNSLEYMNWKRLFKKNIRYHKIPPLKRCRKEDEATDLQALWRHDKVHHGALGWHLTDVPLLAGLVSHRNSSRKLTKWVRKLWNI